MNIILDTNIWISFLLGKRLSVLVGIFSQNNINIYVSKELIKELAEVVSRDKFSNKISKQSFNNLLELINVKCKMVNSDLNEQTELRDKKDLFILGMAYNIPADLVVTGDKDLLDLKSFKNTKMITFNELQTIIKS